MRLKPRRCAIVGVVVLAGSVTTVGGCMMQKQEEFRCSIPTSKNVAEAFAQARNDLAHPECQFQFDGYVDTLLATARGDPGEQNKRHFSELFAFARDEGILSARQAAEHYRRYFTADFVSLNARYNNCSSTCRNVDQVQRDLREELRDKERGMLLAADDEGGYSRADREYNELLTLIEATCRACQRE